MKSKTPRISPGQVHDTLRRHLQVDGFDMVLDLEKSDGRRLYDSRNGRWFLDMFSSFATRPIGLNHPKMKDPDFRAKLERASIINPANSDLYTIEKAEFVDTFERLAMPAELPHMFLVAGGALGVENALKAAFDWKVRRNFAKGIKEEKGHQVLHFREAFHGRSGYTLSLTNTSDPAKYEYFPKFDWPRVVSPKLRFPVTPEEIERVKGAEAESIAQMKKAFAERKDEIACILIEPIQCEGGDNHFRPEFLWALRTLADENEAMLIFDEVQTGMGMTGKMWGYQHAGVKPDMIAFGKKMQVCGMLAGPRIDEEPKNVFKVPSRINSTWGGNLADMVRCERYLEIIEEERLIEHAAEAGTHLLKALERLQGNREEMFSNARGQGLLCAIDLPSGETRDEVRRKAYDLGLVILPCGNVSLRFRPPLDVTADELDEAVEIMLRATEKTLAKTA